MGDFLNRITSVSLTLYIVIAHISCTEHDATDNGNTGLLFINICAVILLSKEE